MAVVVAPAIGPTLGGWITDNYNWRWIFYINVPIGIISLYLTHKLVEDPPYLIKERAKGRPKIDYPGLALLVLGIGCLQVVLDKGQEKDWFSTHVDYGALRGRHLHADCVGGLGISSSVADRGDPAVQEPQFFGRRCSSRLCWASCCLGPRW